MPKPRSKRQAIREERKKKRQQDEVAPDESTQTAKRRRRNEDETTGDRAPEFQDGYEQSQTAAGLLPTEREFFGMLSDQEQEYFRSVDEQLDIDNFPSQEERQLFLASVFAEAQGKELKLACSQSCSRLMERLILMSNTRQKKILFEQFASHFLNLVQHRFASHCCETLFLQSAPIVTRELGGERDDMPGEDEDQDEKPLPYMEELFLLTLDELEGRLSFLLTDRFASHTLRVLLLILSGRPLDQVQTKSLIHSKKKEKISAPWKFNAEAEGDSQLRAVPNSFNLATRKIIGDSVSGMSPTELRVLATHPTGNPVLQLLLELDITLNAKSGDESGEMTLLWHLLPGAPASLKDATTPASDFVNSMLYDAIGSRLLETLVVHCPGKVFKVLYKHILEPRMHSLLRNDIACYPAIRVLNRLSKEDLIGVVKQTIPEFGKLVSLSRFNVIKALIERCQARQAYEEVKALTKRLVEECGDDSKSLVPRLCLPPLSKGDGEKQHEPLAKNRSALVSHGSHLVTAMLATPESPRKAIQASIAALSEEQILELATSSGPTSHVIMDALSTPSQNKIFHKALVAALRPHIMELANSEHGNKVLSSIIAVPSRSDGISLPFHIKESIMTELGQHEQELRDSFIGRRIWRNWKGDLWRNRRVDWIAWAKEVDSALEQKLPDRQPKPNMPGRQSKANRLQHDNPNSISVSTNRWTGKESNHRDRRVKV
ncbi:pumilio-family RNA binding repeat domain-containing protein [Xylaria bambusicola]|uniref:pumilio-family RNA binding repeat domain-containing protein n=1 Tax=Xylaria bambusicola TaxID=326684 RepID=UPI00200750AA|nr:pumilio-family RNA binding repeat domain-containing protein [Xylaria bambusicola]KAI0517786.1 pumilio-family RNA binding repeat domain-containing protein [Xylaria bambusicola]